MPDDPSSETSRGQGSAATESVPGPEDLSTRVELEPAPGRVEFSVGLLVGERYRLERLLGRGGMGEVYLAHDQRLARQVALKWVRASSPNTAVRLQARLEREGLALARVAHPNVVGIHDVGSFDGRPYLVMQYAPGVTLRKWQTTRHRAHELIDVYLQAARGLAVAHSVGVVHRDFKPDNVIVGTDGVVRVLDFGLAAALRPTSAGENRDLSDPRLLATGPDSNEAISSAETLPADTNPDATGSDWGRMTKTGALLGTLPYMSSEQLAGSEADTLSDQFSFCVALWEACSGVRPFEGDAAVTLLAAIRRGPNEVKLRPRWLHAILRRGLSYDAQLRWPSMDALVEAIERGRARGRKLVLGVALTGTIAGAAAFGRALTPSNEPELETCAEFVEQIDRIWNPTARDAISSHRETEPYAIEHAIATLDRLATNWKQSATARCDAELAPALDDAVRPCLQRWLAGFEGTIEVLVQHGDDETLAGAPDILASLVPPNSDYCAEPPVDPEIWRMAVRARALAVLGDGTAAIELADAAIDHANELASDPSESTTEQALAHVARAEVELRIGSPDDALKEFSRAQQYALASGSKHVQLQLWTFRAKLLASQGKADLALADIENAEVLLDALQVGDMDVRRAELHEARGFTERARGRYREAIAHHREAHAVFTAAGRPTLAAKALLNIGNSFQRLGDLERARATYMEALAAIRHLPPTFRNRIQLEHNLALLAAQSTEDGSLAEALRRYEFIVEHGAAQDRLDAIELILLLALQLGDTELLRHWSARAITEYAAQRDPSPATTFHFQQAVGFALVFTDDPRGEVLLAAAQRSAETRSLREQWDLQKSWVDWLEQVGRCSEALAHREWFAGQVAAQAEIQRDLLDEYESWRDAGPLYECAISRD